MVMTIQQVPYYCEYSVFCPSKRRLGNEKPIFQWEYNQNVKI